MEYSSKKPRLKEKDQLFCWIGFSKINILISSHFTRAQ